MDRHWRKTFTGTKRGFIGSSPIHVRKNINDKIISSLKTIPPVPKFWDSWNHVSNGYSRTSTLSYVVTGRVGVTLGPSIFRTNCPFDGLGKRMKTTFLCTNGEKRNIKNLCTVPPSSQSTKVSNRSSFTKSLRSYKPTSP